MSVALLRAKGFKHRLQDDMESVYYVLMYASVHWLPRNKEKNFLKIVSNFFDEYTECIDTTEGGTMKASNMISGYFQEIWHFGNVHLQICLDGMIELLRPFEDQPSWTPEDLNAILESADKEDLPLDDRMDHYQIEQDKIAQREAEFERRYRSEYLYDESIPDLSHSAQTSSANSETSGKRSVDVAGLEECVEPTKRLCIPISEVASSDKGVITAGSQ